MRAQYLMILAPLALAACGGSPPPERPIVINTPTQQAPVQQPTTVILEGQPIAGNLISQCQNLFAQSLAGQSVSYGSPSVGNSGSITTVRLSATNDMKYGGSPIVYECSYNNGTLITAGRD